MPIISILTTVQHNAGLVFRPLFDLMVVWCIEAMKIMAFTDHCELFAVAVFLSLDLRLKRELPIIMQSKSERPHVPETPVAGPKIAHPSVLDRHGVRTTDSFEARSAKTSKPAENLDALFENFPSERHYQPESTILLHGGTADAVYKVISGTVRCCTIDEEGGRQIFSFQKKGGFIGISDIDAWHFTAEAVDHVILRSVPRASLEQELAVSIALREEIRALIGGLLVKREHQLLALISQKAPQRLLNFLQEFATRRSSSGFTVLPMCRRDIADHLGMTTETASRAFGVLKNSGAIEMSTPEKYRLLC